MTFEGFSLFKGVKTDLQGLNLKIASLNFDLFVWERSLIPCLLRRHFWIDNFPRFFFEVGYGEFPERRCYWISLLGIVLLDAPTISWILWTPSLWYHEVSQDELKNNKMWLFEKKLPDDSRKTNTDCFCKPKQWIYGCLVELNERRPNLTCQRHACQMCAFLASAGCWHMATNPFEHGRVKKQFLEVTKKIQSLFCFPSFYYIGFLMGWCTIFEACFMISSSDWPWISHETVVFS